MLNQSFETVVTVQSEHSAPKLAKVLFIMKNVGVTGYLPAQVYYVGYLFRSPTCQIRI